MRRERDDGRQTRERVRVKQERDQWRDQQRERQRHDERRRDHRGKQRGNPFQTGIVTSQCQCGNRSHVKLIE